MTRLTSARVASPSRGIAGGQSLDTSMRYGSWSGGVEEEDRAPRRPPLVMHFQGAAVHFSIRARDYKGQGNPEDAASSVPALRRANHHQESVDLTSLPTPALVREMIASRSQRESRQSRPAAGTRSAHTSLRCGTNSMDSSGFAHVRPCHWNATVGGGLRDLD